MTIVIYNDFMAIQNCMSMEEIEEKYGKLKIMSFKEYEEYKKKIKKRKD